MEDKLVEAIVALNNAIKKLEVLCTKLEVMISLPLTPTTISAEDYE